jgi:hypothetical protein
MLSGSFFYLPLSFWLHHILQMHFKRYLKNVTAPSLAGLKTEQNSAPQLQTGSLLI